MELRIVKAIALVALWLGGAFGLQAQTVVEYVHTDALGTPVAITSAAGLVIQRSVYEPNGQLINRPLTDGPGFTGHVQDAASGLTYMQQRYYDPTIGRFLSVDPVTANSGTGANFNRYWYANNNPYKFMDPDGRAPCRANDFACDRMGDPASRQRQRQCEMTCLGGNGKKDPKNSEPQIPLAGSLGEFAENTIERIARRTSFVANGGAAFGIGGEIEATKTTQPWQKDKVAANAVIGYGAFGGASAKYKLFSWGEQSGQTGGILKASPSSYFRLKLGAGLSVGVSANFNDSGGGSFSISAGMGLGAMAVVKPSPDWAVVRPIANLSWEKEL